MMNKVTVIDGGFSTQLSKYVGSNVDGDPLWSARFNATNPEAVINSHLDFLRAGAQIILTNTYQASVEGYMQYLNLSRDDSIELIKNTVKLTHQARDSFMKEQDNNNNGYTPKIFASIGPYGAHLHDGSEYTGNYAKTVTTEILQKWHSVRLDAVLEVGVDGLAIETIPCLMEAEAVVDLVLRKYPNIKFWTSFQAKDNENLANGELFSKSAKTIWNKPHNGKLLAVGVNCISPQQVTPLFKSVNGERSDAEKIPLIVYPNSGEKYSVELGWHGKESCIPIDEYVPEWINLGAKFLGGCCRTNASDIQRIKQKIESLEKIKQ